MAGFAETWELIDMLEVKEGALTLWFPFNVEGYNGLGDLSVSDGCLATLETLDLILTIGGGGWSSFNNELSFEDSSE